MYGANIEDTIKNSFQKVMLSEKMGYYVQGEKCISKLV